ncbi:MAG: hypothetical protein ACRBM6_22825 [Geminicoccales bacterium]
MVSLNHIFHNRFALQKETKSYGLSWIDSVVIGIKMGWRAYLRYRRLARLSDKALQEQGFKRDEIGKHAFFDQDR